MDTACIIHGYGRDWKSLQHFTQKNLNGADHLRETGASGKVTLKQKVLVRTNRLRYLYTTRTT